MTERVLRVGKRASFFGYDASEAMTGLVQVNVADACLARVALQVLNE
jgi:hypothetical protein